MLPAGPLAVLANTEVSDRLLYTLSEAFQEPPDILVV